MRNHHTFYFFQFEPIELHIPTRSASENYKRRHKRKWTSNVVSRHSQYV